jgi:hypothetical protein
MYKPGGTITAALQRIQQKQYVLPALQREFVWKPEQIERLFDSLMQGYPFGTFLLWKVSPATSAKFRFYDFILNYHERDAAHCPELPSLHNEAIHAVLDGQQRLTALNIGLRGSLAQKQPNKWRTSPDAYPKRTLHLNVLGAAEPDEDGVVYDFRFRKDSEGGQVDGALWFRVSDILGMQAGPAMLNSLMKQGLSGDELARAFEMLDRLFRVVHTEPLIHFYEEETQEIARVLNIFIRLNSGGTVLSYSDLLLSTAVAQWKNLDARAEIHTLVDELNRIGTGFNFTHDFVLKAGLMLADIASVGFKVENFTPANMTKLESHWQTIRTALVRTVELVASFGFNGQTLRADSALLPIAYYLHAGNVPINYVSHTQFAADRDRIRKWLASSLLKASGIWGSGLDTLLTALRLVIQGSDKGAFPDSQLRKEMDSRGKTLQFSEAEIDDLLSMSYEDRRTFVLLSLLFPFVDLRNQFHMDHVFPISRFTLTKMRAAGVLEDKIESLREQANQLPNLQLLDGAANNEKRASLPAAWLAKAYPDQSNSDYYCAKHHLGKVPEELIACETFWEDRREKLRITIDAMINQKSVVASGRDA